MSKPKFDQAGYRLPSDLKDFQEAAHSLQEMTERIDNLECELAAEAVKRENVEVFMRNRIMDMEVKLMDCQSALLICQKALVVFMSDQAQESSDDKPKQLKVV